MTYRSRDLAYLVVTVVSGIGIHFMFRTMYMAEQPLPFAQEMTLVFLGSVVTIALTAALLNRQTELELRKKDE
jgi:flagellar biosynthesis protein FliQ